jgi:hypothetical protein
MSMPAASGGTIFRLWGHRWDLWVLCCVSLAMGVGVGVPFLGWFNTDVRRVPRLALQEVAGPLEGSGPHHTHHHIPTHFQARCPVEFDRISISEMRSGKVLPNVMTYCIPPLFKLIFTFSALQMLACVHGLRQPVQPKQRCI